MYICCSMMTSLEFIWPYYTFLVTEIFESENCNKMKLFTQDGIKNSNTRLITFNFVYRGVFTDQAATTISVLLVAVETRYSGSILNSFPWIP